MHLNQLLEMGGYGMYVWPAYLITLFVFGMNIVITLNEKRRVKKIIKHYLLQTQKLS